MPEYLFEKGETVNIPGDKKGCIVDRYEDKWGKHYKVRLGGILQEVKIVSAKQVFKENKEKL